MGAPGRQDRHDAAAAGGLGFGGFVRSCTDRGGFYRFGIAHDEARVDVVVSCFTEDAVFEVAQGQGEPFTRFTGREELFEQLTRIIAERGDQRRHVISNVVVEELDLAAGTACALAFSLVSVAANGLSLGASVIYTARLRRDVDGCWRFSYFFIGMD